MEKPITVIRKEFIERIANEVNTSGLPIFVIRDIFERMLIDIRQAEEKQDKEDTLRWESREDKEDGYSKEPAKG